MKKTWIAIVVIVVIVLLGLWIWSTNKNSSAPTNTTAGNKSTTYSVNTSDTSMATASPVMTVANNANLGNFLVGANGMTLYTFSKDKPSMPSTCTGGCAALWPPYIVTGELPVGNGINGTVGTTTRADGTLQLTYGGLPVYFYSKDAKVGDTTGQGFGGLWYVVQP